MTKFTPKYRCSDCGCVCTENELDTRDDGCYESFWGEAVWCEYIVKICPECGQENIDEFFDDDEDDAYEDEPDEDAG